MTVQTDKYKKKNRPGIIKNKKEYMLTGIRLKPLELKYYKKRNGETVEIQGISNKNV